MSDSKRGVLSLIAIPALLTLIVTGVRLYGELQGWDPRYFSTEGGPAWFGITWLVPIFGAWFGWRLARQGQLPTSLLRAASGYLLGALVFAGCMWALFAAEFIKFPSAETPGKVEGGEWFLLLAALAFLIAVFAWPRLTIVLVAYGFLARIPVIIITWLDIERGWATHYGHLPPGMMVSGDTELLLALTMPQVTLWPLVFTPLIGGLFGCLGARIGRP